MPFKKLPVQVRETILNGSGEEELEFLHEGERSKYAYTGAFEGVLKNLERRYHETDSEDVREDLERFMSSQPCPECNGARLKKEALFVRVDGKSIQDIVKMSIKDALIFFKGLRLTVSEQEIARRVLKEVGERLNFLTNVGLDYISLDRPAATLSGGEGQRIRLATQIGSSLVGVLYILVEPSIGLHQRDNQRLLGALKRLRDMGNSVLVVEHDEETMQEADYIIPRGLNMTIVLAPDARKQALASLRRFCRDELEAELSDIQVTALLEFMLKEIGPSVYNGAITDAQTFLRARLGDLEATCYEPEFTYWPKGTSVRRK